MLLVSPADSRRRKRRIFLLLSAIVVPSAVVILRIPNCPSGGRQRRNGKRWSNCAGSYRRVSRPSGWKK